MPHDELERVWADQRDFNLLFRKPPESFADRVKLTTDLLLYLSKECFELLDHIPWKCHRKITARENPSAVRDELADIFKYFISVCQVWDVSPRNLLDLYWRKSAVVRARYSSEFEVAVKSPAAVIDIDMVLCDYFGGLVEWVQAHPVYGHILHERLGHLRGHPQWLDAASLGVTPEVWGQIQHDFRISGAKSRLPIMPGADRFLQALRAHGYFIILLTSRPIAEYPNMFEDTHQWLAHWKLPFDHLWWSERKHQVILKEKVREHVAFAVDDMPEYAEQFAKIGVPCYLLVWQTLHNVPVNELIRPVCSHGEILDKIGIKKEDYGL